ncbi:hypothetical protein B0H14DRAFT_2582860 [Mycena olivaceomarginata]|nr:hypothetical protein B0H14DRAFT_2582860 [Mycena olivaceomarginata]
MVLGVTSLQRGWLELTGLLRYLRIYKPRMEDPTAEGGLPDDCVGVFTSDPTIAQLFRIARLPYFFVRPLNAFKEENILRVVQPLDPTVELVLDAAPGYSSVAVGTDIGQRIRSLHAPRVFLGTRIRSQQGRRDSSSRRLPFSTLNRPPALVVQRKAQASTLQLAVHRHSQARVHAKAMKSFSGANPNAKPERDKYMVFDSPDMPPAIDSWARSLAKVDRSFSNLQQTVLVTVKLQQVFVCQLLLALHLLLAHGFRLARDYVAWRRARLVVDVTRHVEAHVNLFTGSCRLVAHRKDLLKSKEGKALNQGRMYLVSVVAFCTALNIEGGPTGVKTGQQCRAYCWPRSIHSRFHRKP